MAIGNVGLFNPGELQYRDPGTYETSLRAEASKIADYLASMDQFYENLAESQRQFNEKLSFETRKWDEGLAWEKDKFNEEHGLEHEKLKATTTFNDRQLDLMEKEINLKYSSTGGMNKLGRDEEFEWFKSQVEKQQSARNTPASGIEVWQSGTGGKTLGDYANSSALNLQAIQNATNAFKNWTGNPIDFGREA